MKMKRRFLPFVILTLSCTLLTAGDGRAADKPIAIAMDAGMARITYLKGKARLTRKGLTEPKALQTGDRLQNGDQIRTGQQSRIEIQLPDKSYIRFEELTKFTLESATVNPKKKTRNISVRMFLGKVWARASRLFSGRGRFAISTRTAVAGVRGTVYRMNVNEDNSAVVKVYYGEVLVSSKEAAEKQQQGPRKVEGPKPVSGPHPIPGPHAVSLEEWMHIVGSMQQIVIKPDGSATRPFRFSPTADEDEWVQWNKRRDEQLKDLEE